MRRPMLRASVAGLIVAGSFLGAGAADAAGPIINPPRTAPVIPAPAAAPLQLSVDAQDVIARVSGLQPGSAVTVATYATPATGSALQDLHVTADAGGGASAEVSRASLGDQQNGSVSVVYAGTAAGGERATGSVQEAVSGTAEPTAAQRVTHGHALLRVALPAAVTLLVIVGLGVAIVLTARRRRSLRHGTPRTATLAYLTGGLVLVLVGIFIVALGWKGYELHSDAGSLRSRLNTVEAQVSGTGSSSDSDRVAAVRQSVQVLRQRAADLDDDTRGVVWSLASHFPGIGKPLRATGSLAGIVGTVSTAVLPDYLSALQDFSGLHLSGSNDLAPVAARAHSFDLDVARLAALKQSAAAVAMTGVGPVDDAHRTIVASLAKLLGYTRTFAVVAHVAPALLGVSRPQHLLFVLETPSEERGTGGLVGGYVAATATKGHLSIAAEGSNHDLTATQPGPVVALDSGFEQLFGTRYSTQDWRPSNISPDFSDVGPIWAGLSQAQTGTPVDGVAALTPETLGRVLAVTGPVTLPDGIVLSAANAAETFEQGIYAKYPAVDQEQQRTDFQTTALHAVVSHLLDFHGDLLSLLSQVGHAVAAGEVRLYASDTEQEAALLTTPVAGALPSAPGPFYGVVTVNGDGSKLDAYLHRQIHYVRQAITGDLRHQRVSVTAVLTNEAPASGLSPYVTYQDKVPDAEAAEAATTPGVHLLQVSFYLGTGAVDPQLTVDGVATTPTIEGRERGHLVVEAVPPPLKPGASETITLTAIEPTSSVPPTQLIQAVAASSR